MPLQHKFGLLMGGALALVDQRVFMGRLPFTMTDPTPDHARLKPAAKCRKPDYPKPDGVVSFDRNSSVYLSGTFHDDNQPAHLRLRDDSVPQKVALLASKADHCLADILHRWKSGELACQIPCVISNHENLRSMVEWHGIPFHSQRGTNHQVDFDLVTSDDIPGTHEEPDLGVVMVDERGDIIDGDAWAEPERTVCLEEDADGVAAQFDLII